MPLPSPDLFPSPDLYPGIEETLEFTPGLLAAFQPWLDNDPVGHYRPYLIALGAMFEPIAQVVMDKGFPGEPTFEAGWSALLDPDDCPVEFLPYLAQFNGTIVPPGTDETSARTLVSGEAGFKRGTPAAMIAAAKRFLAGTQTVLLRERTAANGTLDPYHFVMLVRPGDLTSSMTALINGVEAVKPAGLQGTYLDLNGFPWNTALHTWSADAFSWAAAWTTQP